MRKLLAAVFFLAATVVPAMAQQYTKAELAQIDRDYRKLVAEWDAKIRKCRLAPRIQIGDARAVVLGCIGQPDRTVERRTIDGKTEAFLYGGRKQVVFFENDHVAAIEAVR